MTTDQRVLVHTAANLSVTWQVDGVPTDPDGQATTVGITRADGTVLAAPGTPTTRTGPGAYRYALAPQTELDELTVTWAGTFSGVAQQITSRVEIIGAHLFTVAQARAFAPKGRATLADAATYPDADIIAVRDQLLDDFQRDDVCGVAFVPRYARVRLDGTGTDRLLLPHLRVQRVLAVSVTLPGAATETLTGDDWRLGEHDVLERATGVWPSGRRTVTVAYVHGWERCPAPVRQAALRVAFSQLVGSSVDDRVTNFSDEDGTYTLATAGRGAFQPYGIPLADAALRRYRQTVPGIA